MQSILKGCHLQVTPWRTRATRLLSACAMAGLCSVGFAGSATAQYVTPEPPRTGTAVDVPTQRVVDATGAVGSAARSVAGPADNPRSAQSRSNGSSLPVTGGDVLSLTAIGVGAIAAGGLLVHARRRTTRT